jgi:TPP-dependent 2-oxoacid decarboxylase
MKVGKMNILPKILLPIHKNDLIRIGAINDGGYVLTKNIIEVSDFLLSFGVSFDWTFEEEFLNLKKKKMEIHAYDHTINNYSFQKHFLKSIIKSVSKPANKKNIENIFKKRSYDKFFVV